MTPGINAAKKSKVFYKIHEYLHEPSATSYGTEAAEKLGVSQEQVFKTLIVNLDDKGLAVGIVPISFKLNMKLLAKAADAKKAVMAESSDVERSTGYVLGGVSPLGQKKRLKTFIHESAKGHSTIFVSAGRRGLEIELKPVDLQKLTNAKFVKLSHQE